MSLPAWLKSLGAVWDFIDRRQVVRRVMVGASCWIVIDTVLWMREFSEATDRTGADISVIFAAIGVPLSMVFTTMFVRYDGQRAREEGEK